MSSDGALNQTSAGREHRPRHPNGQVLWRISITGFFKLLATDGIFPEDVDLEDLMEIDQALHRSLAATLQSMPDSEISQALEFMTFRVPSRTQQGLLLGYNHHFFPTLYF